MNFRRSAVLSLATGGGVGYLPVAPGTVGTLVGLPLCYAASRLDLQTAAIGVALFTALAVWVAGDAARYLKRKDPGCIVIDEVAGLLVALLGHEWSVATVLVGFGLFRGLDVCKPFPISWLDRHLTGGFGIVMDDIAAGVISNFALTIIIQLIDKI